MKTEERPDYGIDAPGVVRNLAIAGAVLLLVVAASLVSLIPRQVSLGPGVRLEVVPSLLPAGFALSAAACGMYFGSKYGKVGEREKLVGRIDWKGDEQVLDVGCGRGLILIGAALRLTTGKAVGIDIWQSEDLSGNQADVPMKNAALEGVADKVTVQTADMRRIPFPDKTFDVVLSRAAIHNLYTAEARETAIREIARVLKPGGRAVITDIRHHGEYGRVFVSSGCPDVKLLDSKWVSALSAVFTLGMMRPNTTLARKAG